METLSMSNSGCERGQGVSELHKSNLTLLGRNDVIIASYGGSGQAFLANLLLELGFNYVDPYTEKLHVDGSTSIPPEHVEYRQRLEVRRSGGGVRPWPRFVKTHLFPGYFVKTPVLQAVWLLVRDPRDALYSWYRWRRDFAQEDWDEVDGSFPTFLEQPDKSGYRPTDDWASFYTEWMTYATERGSAPHIVRFEDLKQDSLRTLSASLATVQLAIDEAEVKRALDNSSFESMRAREDRAAARLSRLESSGRVMRAGKVGGWREWITPPVSQSFTTEHLTSVAAQLGYLLDS
jgi:hypothetical protein